jgi:hypothetical protein
MTCHYVRSNDLNPLKDLLTGDMFMDLRRDAASRMKNRTGVWEVWMLRQSIWCLKISPKQTKTYHMFVRLLRGSNQGKAKRATLGIKLWRADEADKLLSDDAFCSV